MKADSFFRWCCKVSAAWIFFCVIGGAESWKFPLPIKDAWQKQKMLFEQHWK